MAPKAKEKPKPAHPAVAVEDLFTSLSRHIQRSEAAPDDEQEKELDQAIRIADQVLSVSPGDEDAIRCKIVAFIRKGRTDRALSSIEEFSGSIPSDLGFLKAYCLYRQHKAVEALEILKEQEESDATLLLESQILNRLGKFDACVDTYKKLFKSRIDSLEINVVAGLVSAGRAHEVQGTMDLLRVKATKSYELAFNTAYSLIERNKLADAEELLLSAQGIGLTTLKEDDVPEDVIEKDLAPITVQLAYIQQILGHTQNALDSYSNIIKKNIMDKPTLAVAINNLIALKGSKDASDSLRKLDRLTEKGNGEQKFQLSPELDVKLSLKQKEALYLNRMQLLLNSNRMDEARELAAALPGMFPHSVMPLLLQAAVHVRENKAAKAEELLGQYAEKLPEKSKVLLLARAQIAAAAGHHLVSAESLGRITDIQHMPATIATIASLKERAGDTDGAEAVFDSAIQWWSNAMTEDDKFELVMQEAAALKFKHGKKEEAASLYEQLVKSRGNIEALVGLIQTASQTDLDKAEAYEKQLRPLSGLKVVDIEGLEKTSGAKPVETSPIQEAHEARNKDKTKKKRKRKPKYPKGFDPANPGPLPDPERWLPKRERSSYRPKRKDKRAAQVRGSQGSVVKEAPSSMNSKPNETANSKGSSQSAANTEQSKAVSSKSSKKKSRR